MSSRRRALWIAAAFLVACGARVASRDDAGGGAGGAGGGGAGGGGGTGSAGAGAASGGGKDSGASGAAGEGGTPEDAALDVPPDGVACVSDDECAVADPCRRGRCNAGRCEVRLQPVGYVCPGFVGFCDEFGECRQCDWDHLEFVCPKPSNYCCWQLGVVRKCKESTCTGEFIELIYRK